MQCRTCNSSLPVNAANCPNCGSSTPYNVPGAGASSVDPTLYASPVSPPMNPTMYAPPSYGSPNPYAPPPPQEAINPYNTPPQGTYGAYSPPMPGYQPAPPKRKSNVGLIIGIVAGVLILACVGSFTAIALFASNSPTTEVSPSGITTVPAAASIITSAQTASGINEQTLVPTALSTTFKKNSNVYVAFNLDLDKANVDFTQQNAYIGAKMYSGDTFVDSNTITIDRQNYQDADVGYFTFLYNVATEGTVELYWCLKADCSDGQLARFVKFTVTD